MKTDLYTKAVLTVIAVALCAIVFQNANVVTPAHASAPPVEVPVPAPVPAAKEVIDVNIVKINGNTIWGNTIAVEADITKVAGSTVYNSMPVKVENKVEVKLDR